MAQIITDINPWKFETGDVLKMKNGRLRVIRKASRVGKRGMYIALQRVVPHPTRDIAAYLWTDLKDKIIQHIKF